MSINRPLFVFVLLTSLFLPLFSFQNGNIHRECFRSSFFTERESNEDMETEKTPLTLFMDALTDSLLSESVPSFQKISLTEPIDDGFAPQCTAIDGRFLKEKNMLQFSKKKGKTALGSSSNHDINDGISFIQRCLQKDQASTSLDEQEDVCLFQMAILSTKNAEYEIKLKKGRGKFKITSKESAHLDREEIMKQSLTGIKDQKTIRKILEDRRLLLLSDPKDQTLKALYAEAKWAAESSSTGGTS